MLIYVSGVPMTELQAWRKYHHQPIFDTYIKNTSIVFPWVGKKGISPYLKFYFKKQK